MQRMLGAATASLLGCVRLRDRLCGLCGRLRSRGASFSTLTAAAHFARRSSKRAQRAGASGTQPGRPRFCTTAPPRRHQHNTIGTLFPPPQGQTPPPPPAPSSCAQHPPLCPSAPPHSSVVTTEVAPDAAAAASATTAAAAEWVTVGPAAALAATGRLHTTLGAGGRHVSVLRLADGRLTAIDSICFHAGGPLALGDIEDVQGRTCLVCPWHDYKIDVLTGEKYYVSAAWQDGRMVPGGLKSNGPRHRIHAVEERADGQLYVQLNTDPAPVASDEYAFNAACGGRITGSPSSGSSARSAAAAGADGKMPRR